MSHMEDKHLLQKLKRKEKNPHSKVHQDISQFSRRNEASNKSEWSLESITFKDKPNPVIFKTV